MYVVAYNEHVFPYLEDFQLPGQGNELESLLWKVATAVEIARLKQRQ